MSPLAKVALFALGAGIVYVVVSEPSGPNPGKLPSPTPGPTPGMTPGTTPSMTPGSTPAPGSTPGMTPGSTPAPGPAPDPWCSSVSSSTAPPALDDQVIAYARAQPNVVLPILWLQLALNVAGFSEARPTYDRLKDSVLTPGEFDTLTMKALERAMPEASRPPIADKNALIVDAFRRFVHRDTAKDGPCPVSVPADIAQMLERYACGLADTAGETAAYPCDATA